jgi:hypothetical protein
MTLIEAAQELLRLLEQTDQEDYNIKQAQRHILQACYEIADDGGTSLQYVQSVHDR